MKRINWDKLAEQNGYISEGVMFYEMHWTRDMTLHEMADEFNVTRNCVWMRMKALGINRKPRGGCRRPRGRKYNYGGPCTRCGKPRGPNKRICPSCHSYKLMLLQNHELLEEYTCHV